MAITVPVVTSVLERRRLRWEGEQRRFDELRALLDSAVARLTDARNLLYDALQASGRDDRERVQQIAADYRATTSEIMKDNLRILLRLGERAAIAQAHWWAASKCAQLESELDAYLEKPEGGLVLKDFHELGGKTVELMEKARGLVGVKA